MEILKFSQEMPAIFVAHGAPTIIMEDNEFTKLLKKYGENINHLKGIIIFSAHWTSPTQQIGCDNPYEILYDFYGFPDELYNFTANYNGSGDIAKDIQQHFNSDGINSLITNKRGMDHGAWTILKLMFNEVLIPVINMSVNPSLSPEQLYNIGKSLKSLKKQGYLIICSGGIVHNLREINFNSNSIDTWSLDFNNWIKDKVSSWNLNDLFDYEKIAPHAKLAVPTKEHFIPLFIAMGAGDENKNAKLLSSVYEYKNLSLDFWEFE